MNRFAAAAALIPFAVPAFAADIPVKAPPAVLIPSCIWCGWYVGFNGGYGKSADTDKVTLFTNSGFTLPGASLRATGGFGGGQVGYNWQKGALVLGIETDFQGADLRSSFNNQPDGLGDTINAHRNIDYFGTVRGRLGFAVDHWLFYGTGGFAYGRVDNNDFIFNPGASANLSKSATEGGFSAGGGIEYSLSRAWSVKVEYQYIGLGHDTLFAQVVPLISGETIVSNRINNSFNTIRAGVNYHFN